MRYRREPMGRLFAVLTVAAAVCGAVAFLFYSQLKEYMYKVCESKCRQAVNSVIGDAISESLEGYDGGCLSIDYDKTGNISSVQTDTYKINTLESEIKSAVDEGLSKSEDNEISVPVGTLTGITALSGKGFEITAGFLQSGSCDGKIESEFSSAGLNQTRHSLRLEITAEITVTMPGRSDKITVSDEYIIGETIIVGKLPDSSIMNLSGGS